MKLIKKLCYIFIFFIAIILINCGVSKAAGTALPTSTRQMSDWIRSDDEKFYTMDAAKLVKTPIGLSEYNGGTWVCYNGNDNTNVQATSITIKNVIDITSSGATIYYSGKTKEANKGVLDVLHQVGYYWINEQSQLQKEIKVINTMYKNKALLRQYGIYVPERGPGATYSYGKFPENKKMRIVIGSIAGGQDRIFVGYKDGVKTTSLKVRKVDSMTGAALAGATFQLKSKDGKIVMTAKSNYKGWAVFKNVPFGKVYEITETKAPSGFIKSDEVKIADLRDDSVFLPDMRFFNEEKTGSVNVYKYIEGTKVPIPNVKFIAMPVEPPQPGPEPIKPTAPTRPTRGEGESDESYNKKLAQYESAYSAYQQRLSDYNIAYQMWYEAMELWKLFGLYDYPTIAYTDESGKAIFEGFSNVLDYTITEAPASEQYPEVNAYFEIIEQTKYVDIKGGKTASLYFYNKRIAVDIKGFVWEDKDQNKGAQNTPYNSKYDEYAAIDETLVENVKVRLLDKNGQIIQMTPSNGAFENIKDSIFEGIDGEIKIDWGNVFNPGNTTTATPKNAEAWTNVNGEYYFPCVKVKDLDGAYMEFEYNGMKYKSVIPSYVYSEDDNNSITSQAKDVEKGEGKTREQLTKTYNTITNNSPSIEYNRDEQYASRVVYTDATKGDAYASEYYGRDEYHVCATTREAGLDLYRYYETAGGLASGEMNINLGIYEREQPNLAVKKDIDQIKVSINGYEQLYNYADRFKRDGEEDFVIEPSRTNTYYYTDVKFNNDSSYANMSYVRPLYASDIIYDGANKLEVYVTYKVAIKNKATTLNSITNELVDYYSSDYEFVAAGETLDGQGMVSGNTYQTQQSSDGIANGYKKLTVNTALEVNRERTKQFYMQFKINENSLRNMVKQNPDKGQIKLDNFIEINSYTTKDNTGNLYAGIDQNSQPGNMIPNDVNTYEDDMDKAPGLYITLNQERSIQGNVFEDLPINSDDGGASKKEGAERIGNGIKDDGEGKPNNITVDSVEIIPATEGESRQSVEATKVYKDPNNTSGQPATVNIGDDGFYAIGGFIPGEYMIRYNWSNGSSTVQKYKGTIYNEKDRKDNVYWYLDTTERNGATKRYSDAMDDMTMRTQIDTQSNVMKNQLLEGNKDATGNTVSTQMKSYTPQMSIGVEHGNTSKSGVTNWQDEIGNYELDDSGNIRVNESGEVQIKVREKFIIKEVDFGLIERPRQELDLDKRVSRMTLVGTDGILLVDITINEKGEIEGESKNVVYLGPSSTNPIGMVKAELDNEIKQSSTLIVKYEFTIRNTSELDYWNTTGGEQTYYLYGVGQDNNNLVYLKPDKIIDYIDNTADKATLEMFKDANNENWTFISDPAEKEKIFTDGFVNQAVKDNTINAINKIAIFDKFTFTNDKGLSPIKEIEDNYVKTTLTISRLLSTSNDDVDITNFAEILQITKTAGATLEKSILGNLDISTLVDSKNNVDQEKIKALEPDSSLSEQVSIIDATGENRNYAFYIIIGMLSLATVATGVILIKKKVLK